MRILGSIGRLDLFFTTISFSFKRYFSDTSLPIFDETMRKLASIRRIGDIQPIPTADQIVCATVDGWKAVIKKETNDKLIIDLNQLNDRIQTKLSNKTAIGQNFLTIIDQFGNKLDTDLGQFENELKGAGDYEAPRGLPPDTEVSGNLPLLCLFHSHVLHALLLIDCFSFNIGCKR